MCRGASAAAGSRSTTSSTGPANGPPRHRIWSRSAAPATTNTTRPPPHHRQRRPSTRTDLHRPQPPADRPATRPTTRQATTRPRHPYLHPYGGRIRTDALLSTHYAAPAPTGHAERSPASGRSGRHTSPVDQVTLGRPRASGRYGSTSPRRDPSSCCAIPRRLERVQTLGDEAYRPSRPAFLTA